jgi:dihydroneopterin aldolase
MDKIELKGMRFFGYHGVYPEENKLGQQFVVDLVMHLDLSEAGSRDDLAATVNYAEVCGLVREIVTGPPLRLVEALAERIATKVLATYTIVGEITVRVTKPHPPVDIRFDGVTVEIHRRRS